MDATNTFALLMVGQPMLLRRLRFGSFAALDQRLSTRYQLQPLDPAEAVQYLRHHLALAGGKASCKLAALEGRPLGRLA